MLNILIYKIMSLALILLAGFALVRWGPLTKEDTRSLSRLNCYLIMPCSIFGAFQMERSPEVLRGLLYVILGALLIHGLYLLVTAVLQKPLRLSPAEQASAFCTNAGNLIIPLVTAMLGKEWVIYTCAYILVQTILLWSHVKNMICGEKGINLKAILLNPNILALIGGSLLFFLNQPLRGLAEETLSSVASMVGPCSMLVIGMTMGSAERNLIFKNRRVFLVAGLRLLFYPLLALGLLLALGRAIPQAVPFFLITMMAASAPSAAVITHICQLYGRDPRQASAICTVTTVLCTLTIPLMIFLYTLFSGMNALS